MSFGSPEQNILNEPAPQEYIYKEIADLEPLALSVVNQLKDLIERGEYDVIIGDDRSGRVPTLILEKIIDKYNHGGEPIKTFFVAGGNKGNWSSWKEGAVGEYVDKIAGNFKKALLITESMGTGEGTGRFIDSLEKTHLDFDVVSFESAHDLDYYNALDNFSRHKLIIGKENVGMNYIAYRKTGKFAGVHKVGHDILSERDNGGDSAEWNPERISGARKDIALMAERVYRQVWSQ